ncbi:glycosyltransferase family 2 protein [Patescibacteria group bacterium]|nr:glycosyltransferase family 2 protein [Patescibacteria group bacterium]MBU4512908.1 glycosyltransferase family 2 protein [Patescibacteria group bacterium]
MSPLITIVIITWNSRKFLPYCLESIFEQTFKDFSIIIVDNGSTDGTVEYIKQEYPMATCLKNFKNLGFCRANNQGIHLAKGEYVLLCNTDIILKNDFLKNAMKTIESDKNIASVGGKLLKAKWDSEELPKPIKTDIIDSCGLRVLKSHHVVERGENEKDEDQYSKPEEIFGISGALMLLRKSALEDIKYKEEYFDENFFSYKEDVDLDWRFRLAGYISRYNPQAHAYHFRGVSKGDDRKTRSKLINQLSYKNHLLSLLKNLTFANLVFYFPFIFFYELKKLVYVLLFEQSTFPGLFKFFSQLGETLDKRRFIMKGKQVSDKEIRGWIT